MKNKKEITLDSLALMIANRFDEMDEKMNKSFKEVRVDIEKVKDDVEKVKDDIKKVKSDTEEIKANLNKKVDKIEHNTLTYRVEKLEKKLA